MRPGKKQRNRFAASIGGQPIKPAEINIEQKGRCGNESSRAKLPKETAPPYRATPAQERNAGAQRSSPYFSSKRPARTVCWG
jgi:hypothetical protein